MSSSRHEPTVPLRKNDPDCGFFSLKPCSFSWALTTSKEENSTALRTASRSCGSMVDRVMRGRRVTDWAREGARVGIAYRYPLLDRRLLRFWLSVPPEMFEPRERDDRWMLRQAAAGLVPDPARLAPTSRHRVGWHGFGEVRRVALAALGDRVDFSLVDPKRAAMFDLARLRRDLRDGDRASAAATLHWVGVGRRDE